jgi:hypothetical protein
LEVKSAASTLAFKISYDHHTSKEKWKLQWPLQSCTGSVLSQWQLHTHTH